MVFANNGFGTEALACESLAQCRDADAKVALALATHGPARRTPRAIAAARAAAAAAATATESAGGACAGATTGAVAGGAGLGGSCDFEAAKELLGDASALYVPPAHLADAANLIPKIP